MGNVVRLEDYRSKPRPTSDLDEVRQSLEYNKRRKELHADMMRLHSDYHHSLRTLLAAGLAAVLVGGMMLAALVQCMPG